MKHTFLIPKSERLALLKRLLIVWGVALVIALLQWVASGYASERLSVYLVYSYAISSCIWFFNDPCRYFFRGQQAKNWYSLPFLVVGCLLVHLGIIILVLMPLLRVFRVTFFIALFIIVLAHFWTVF